MGGGGKETGRQKMIGMMYLVLTALLAMNVSKDVLNAFVIVNNGLQQTNVNFGKKNDKTYADFEAAKAKDPAKVEEYYKRAMQAKKLSADLYTYIETLKKHLIEVTDKKPKEVADTLPLKSVDSKDNYDVPTEIMIGSEPASPKDGEWTAKDLRKRIADTRSAFIKMFDDPSNKLFLPKTKEEMDAKLGMNTEDPKEAGHGGEGKETWETQNFYHLPLAAVITNLSEMQADLRNAEADVVTKLFSAVSGKDFKFDKLVAKVIAKSSYVLAGDKYEADVLLVAFNSTQNPKVIIGSVDTSKGFDETKNPMVGSGDSTSVVVSAGMGKYERATSAEGLQKWSGVIKVEKPGGGYNYYPFASEYMVAKPAIAVSPTKMNVFYIGVDNPIDVSAAGVAPENLVVNLGGQGTLSGAKGKYTVRVTGGTEATVNVGAKFGAQTKPMGAPMKFRVKRLPDPYAFLQNKRGDISLRKTEVMAAGGIVPKMENFDFELPLSITGFDLTLNLKGDLVTKSSKSNKFSDEMLKLIQGCAGGTKVYIENIKCKMPDGTSRQLPGINLKLTI